MITSISDQLRPYLPYLIIAVCAAILIPLFFALSRATEPAETISPLVKMCAAAIATGGNVPSSCYLIP